MHHVIASIELHRLARISFRGRTLIIGVDLPADKLV